MKTRLVRVATVAAAIVVASVVAGTTVSTWQMQRNSPKAIDYYGYGDSISATDDMYVMQMQTIHDPTAIASHNTDGDGKTSCWGYTVLNQHYNRSMDAFIYMFTNDKGHLLWPELSATCYLLIYAKVVESGSRPVPVIPILRAGDQEEEANYLKTIEWGFDLLGLPHVPMYDAIDSAPGNGQLDTFVPENYVDGIHPTIEAQRAMADYLWDYMETHNV